MGAVAVWGARVCQQVEGLVRPLAGGAGALRTRRGAAVAGASLLAVAGAAATTLTGAGTADAASTPACTTASLAAVVKAGEPGAGQRYATLVLTNTSRAGCIVGGYGGLALLGAPGQGVPTDLVRVEPGAVQRNYLAPGASARSLLHWTAVAAGDEGQRTCEPTAPTAVVTPPGQRSALLVAWGQGPVCQHGRITQEPYTPGSAAF